MEILLLAVLILGVPVLFWFMMRHASERVLRQYRILAENFGLELTVPPAQLAGFNRPEPFVHGQYRGREMSISVPGRGLQDTRQIETCLKVGLSEKRFSWQMAASGWLGGMRQRDSGVKSRWMSGDSEFDAAVDVRTDDSGRLAVLLDTDTRKSIIGLLKGSPASISCRQGVLTFLERGVISDDRKREQYEQVVEIFCDLAESMEEIR